MKPPASRRNAWLVIAGTTLTCVPFALFSLFLLAWAASSPGLGENPHLELLAFSVGAVCIVSVLSAIAIARPGRTVSAALACFAVGAPVVWSVLVASGPPPLTWMTTVVAAGAAVLVLAAVLTWTPSGGFRFSRKRARRP